MSKADRPARSPGQLALELDADLQAERRKLGRVEQMVAAAIDAAVEHGSLDAQLDAGAAALAVAAARSVDRGAGDPYAVAAVARELAQLLVELRLTPASRDPHPGAGGVAGEVSDWLRDVSRPS